MCGIQNLFTYVWENEAGARSRSHTHTPVRAHEQLHELLYLYVNIYFDSFEWKGFGKTNMLLFEILSVV